MPCFICVTCGTQHAETAAPPASCEICEDERQYVGAGGQRWTTLDELRADYRARIEDEDGLLAIGTTPAFAIDQRALLVETPHGNVLWDCVTLVDDEGVRAVEERGGAAAIAISHPHYYSCMVEWSEALGGVPIYLHAADRRWVMRPDERIVFWEGATHELLPGVTLVLCGGHYDGGTVLHWAGGAGGRGALLSGDIVQVVPDRGWVSFMYSYPNLIPLPARTVRGIAETLSAYPFEKVYGAFWGRVVREDGAGAVARSAERYVRAIDG